MLSKNTFLPCILLTLCLAISNESTGQVTIRDTSVLMHKSVKLNNPREAASLTIETGTNDDRLLPQVSVYNYSTEGGGARTGIRNYVRSKGNEPVTGVYSELRSQDGGDATGILTVMDSASMGSKTGVRNVIYDRKDKVKGSAYSLYGISTRIDHAQRVTAYGSSVEIDRGTDVGMNQESYGYYVSYKSTVESGARQHGIHSVVPGAGNWAGHFTGEVAICNDVIKTSDARLKTAAKPIKNASKLVRKLSPKRYKFKKNGRFGYDEEREECGFLAQEIAQVLPSIVHDINHPEVMEHSKGEEEIAVDQTGEIDKELTIQGGKRKGKLAFAASNFKGVRYNDVLAVLTAAVQEQQGELDRLAGKVKLKDATGKNATPDVAARLKALRATFEAIGDEMTAIEEEIGVVRGCGQCGG